jgi:DNA invertase Pin-like site-specific DNA recombinase
MHPDGGPRVIAYVRVSTAEQAESGAGLDVQRSTIKGELARRGWTALDWLVDAGVSARTLERPALGRALELLAASEADILMVAKMDRLSRSLLDFASLVHRAQAEGWRIAASDAPFDLSTPSGEAMAGVMAVFAQLERRLIGERTRAALAQRRAAGVVLGRPRIVSEEVERRMVSLRRDGLSVRQVGRQLALEGLPAPGGGAWNPSTVHRTIARAHTVASGRAGP